MSEIEQLSADPMEKYRPYWTALGRFIHEFARVEYLLQVLLRTLTGLSPEISGAIFADFRVASAKDAINRILIATDQSEAHDRLAPALDQMSTISGVRNKAVHLVASHDGQDALLVSNARLGVSPDRLREFRISPLDLEAMSLDLFRIGIQISLEIRPDLRASHPENWGEITLQPWLYKPQQQSTRRNPRHKTAARPTKRPVPPESFRG
jgi:hypothetical protein